MNQLTNLLNLNKGNVKVLGFPALAGLTPDVEENEKTIYVSTLPAAQMLAKGISNYYAPVIPRGSKFDVTQDVLDAPIELISISAETVDDIKLTDEVIIVTQHKATIDVLKSMYSNVHAVYDGNVTSNDVFSKNVVGVLPPSLISSCAKYKAYSISGYDAGVDGDLNTEETTKRLIANDTIKLYAQSVRRMLEVKQEFKFDFRSIIIDCYNRIYFEDSDGYTQTEEEYLATFKQEVISDLNHYKNDEQRFKEILELKKARVYNDLLSCVSFEIQDVFKKKLDFLDSID